MSVKLVPNIGFVQRGCHFECPVTGKTVTTHRQRANIMAEHGLIDANDFPPAKTIEKQNRKKAKRDEIAAGLHKPLLIH